SGLPADPGPAADARSHRRRGTQMKCDCIVLGAELDSFVAAAHLAEQGYSVQLLSLGAGSLHYAPAGIHVLGYAPGAADGKVADPYAQMADLGCDHPYGKLGVGRVRESLEYFAGLGKN